MKEARTELRTPFDKNKPVSDSVCQTACDTNAAVEAVMTKYLLARMCTFRTITPTVAIHHARSLSAAVTLPRLSTRRQTEEFSP